MSPRRLALIGAAVLLVVVVGGVIAWALSGTLRSEVKAIAVAVTPGQCHSLNGLPDPRCTPGLADPRVTQDNIHTTICVSGYTAKVRPSSVYTRLLKQKQIKEYGYTDTNLADYEEDHLIPLELGGHPTDPRNLWPEPLTGPYGATRKDGLENSLHSKVCSDLITLAAAQSAITTNWEQP